MRSKAIIMVLLLPACAQLHHAQLGDIDDRNDAVQVTPIDIKVSETGVSTLEAGEILKPLARTAAQRAAVGDAQLIAELFQMGPRTGNPVLDASYAENVLDLLKDQCRNGDVSNLQLVRETRRYPVVSGEIVRITGDCRRPSDRSRPS